MRGGNWSGGFGVALRQSCERAGGRTFLKLASVISDRNCQKGNRNVTWK